MPAVASAGTREEIYYGWKIVAALFVMLTFCSGLGFYNHAVMLSALSQERGFPVTIASSAVSVFFLASGLVGPVLASLIERFDVRFVINTGAVLASVSLALIGSVETELQLFVLYIIFGIGFAASGLLPATTLITRWFQKSRAVALSVASTGLSIGGVLVTPASAGLIENLGMSAATPLLGAVYFLGVLPLSIIVLRGRPADLGLGVDGGDVNQIDASGEGIPFERAFRMWYFWGLGIAYTFIMAAQVGSIAHQYGIVGEYADSRTAALALGILPLFSIIGRLAGGFVIDRVSTRGFTLFMMALQSCSLTLMALSPSMLLLGVGLALFGITVGNLLMLQPLLIAETFGLVNYARIYSINNLLTMLGVAAGPLAMGYLYADLGAYQGSYLAAGVTGVFAFAIYGLTRPPGRVQT